MLPWTLIYCTNLNVECWLGPQVNSGPAYVETMELIPADSDNYPVSDGWLMQG